MFVWDVSYYVALQIDCFGGIGFREQRCGFFIPFLHGILILAKILRIKSSTSPFSIVLSDSWLPHLLGVLNPIVFRHACFLLFIRTVATENHELTLFLFPVLHHFQSFIVSQIASVYSIGQLLFELFSFLILFDSLLNFTVQVVFFFTFSFWRK